jgi:hypothetical protein
MKERYRGVTECDRVVARNPKSAPSPPPLNVIRNLRNRFFETSRKTVPKTVPARYRSGLVAEEGGTENGTASVPFFPRFPDSTTMPRCCLLRKRYQKRYRRGTVSGETIRENGTTAGPLPVGKGPTVPIDGAEKTRVSCSAPFRGAKIRSLSSDQGHYILYIDARRIGSSGVHGATPPRGSISSASKSRRAARGLDFAMGSRVLFHTTVLPPKCQVSLTVAQNGPVRGGPKWAGCQMRLGCAA